MVLGSLQRFYGIDEQIDKSVYFGLKIDYNESI